MDATKLVRERDTYLYTLVVDIHEWENKWRVRVIERCEERSPMPTSFEWLDGGKTAKATAPHLKRAIAAFEKDGWCRELAPDARARIDARREAGTKGAKARATGFAARVKAFPKTALDKKLAAAIAKPKGVIALDLRGSATNRLSVIPPSIKKLKELEILHAEGNDLSEVPEELATLRALRELHLANNALVELPRDVWFLTRLTVMNLHGNRFTDVYSQFGGYVQRGLEYQIAGNPFWRNVWVPLDKVSVLGIETDHLLPVESTWPLARLDLYGRSPTKAELAALAIAFPSATIEYFDRIEDGPRTTPPAPAPKPETTKKPKAKPLHPDHEARIKELVAIGKKARVPEAEVRTLVSPYLEVISRPATKKDLAPGKTRFGGIPDLAPDTEWPVGSRGSMLFVAQFDLADLAPFDHLSLLPAKGALSFFVASHDQGAIIYTTEAVEPATWPDDVDFAVEEQAPSKVCGMTLTAQVNVRFSSTNARWNQIKHPRRKGARHAMLMPSGGKHPDLGIEADDVILLQLDSDERADMQWGDCGQLFFVIDAKSLAKRAWDRVRVVATP